MENKVPKITLKSDYGRTRIWVWLSIIGVLLLFMNQNVAAQTTPPCTAPGTAEINLVGVDATSATANNAKIRITGNLAGNNKIGYSVGSTYTGADFASAVSYTTLLQDSSYISRTLPTPTNQAGTVYTVRVYSTDGNCFTDKTFTLEYVNFNTAPKNPDISVTVSHNGGEYVALNSTVTVTVAVKNTGNLDATGVEFKIGIPAGFTNVTATAPAGTSYANGVWTVGTVAAGPDVIALTLTGTVTTRGIQTVTAQLTKENEQDIDSSPNTNNAGEDDQGLTCISTPFDYCDNDVYKIELPNYTGVKWFKDGIEITATNADVIYQPNGFLTVLKPGVYSYTTTGGPGTCPSGGCCPIKIEQGLRPILSAIDPQSICKDASFNPIAAQLTQNPLGTVIYEWYNDNGANNPTTGIISGQTTANFTALPDATLPTAIGVYKYKLKVYEQNHINCADSLTFTLTIRDIPVISINNVAPVCAKDTIKLVLVGNVASDTYAWTGPAGFTASVANPDRLNAALDFAGSYSVTVTNVGLCSATASTSVIVNALPPVLATDPKVLCQDDQKVDLVLNVKDIIGSNTLIWYGISSVGGVATTSIELYDPKTPGTNTFYVSQKDANGCISDRVPLDVKVNPRPDKPKAEGATYCQGIAATPLVATGAYDIIWYGQSSTGGTPSSVAPSPSTVDVGTFYFYVSQKNTFGCESKRDSAVVKVNATPPAPGVNPLTYCEKATPDLLTASGVDGNTIMWQSGGSPSTTAPIINTSVAGLTYFYVSQIIPNTGCESPMAALLVTVNPKPVADVLAVNSLCVGSASQDNAQLILTRYRNSDEVSFNIGSTYGTPTASNYTTVPSGGVFASNLPNPTTGTQKYSVRIKNSFGCTTDRDPVLTQTNCSCPGGYCEPATITKLK